MKDIANKYSSSIINLAKTCNIDNLLSFLDRSEVPEVRKTKIKNICVICSRMYNGGVEKTVADLLFIWKKMRLNIILLTEEEENQLDYEYPKEIKRYIIPKSNNIADRLSCIEKIVIDNSIDLVINNSWLNESSIWECILLKYYNVFYIQYAHGSFSSLYKSLDRNEFSYHKIFHYFDMVLALSKTDCSFFNMCGVASYLLKNPITQISSKSKDNIGCDVLWVGRISKDKNTISAIKMMNELKNFLPNVQLHIVGKSEDNDYMNEVNDEIRNLKLENNIVFEGFVKNTHDFYKKSKLLIFTSPAEGYPLVLSESIVNGLPIVMYELPYLSIVEDNKGIIQVKQNDYISMAKIVYELLTNDKKYNKLVKETNKKANTLYKYNLVNEWKNVFKICINKDIKNKNYYTNMNKYDYMVVDELFDDIEEIINNRFEIKNRNSTVKKKMKAILKILNQ